VELGGLIYKDRLFQTQAVDSAISYMQRGGMAGLITSATGTGKSIIIAKLIKRLMVSTPDLRVVVATHVAELVGQNAKKLQTVFPNADIGIYSAGLGQKQKHRQVTFAGIQSIFGVDLEKTHLLIIDEAHTIGRKDQSMWLTFINMLKAKNPKLRIIGLSATPFRMDSGNLTTGDDALFDEVIFEYGLGRAVQDGYLVELVPKHTETKYDISNVKKTKGDYNIKELETATNIDELTRSAVSEMIEKGKNRKTWLIFCNGVNHSFAVRDELRRNNISCETVTGDTLDNERNEILARYLSGELQAVTNNAVWTTGLDVPTIDMIVMMRHTMSGGLLLQMAGRGTRVTIDLSPYESAKERREAIKASDKPNCIFLDFAGNIYRHGFLDQIKGKDKKKKKGDSIPPMKFCTECATICHAAARKCPDCGFEFPKSEKEILEGSYDGAVMSSQVAADWRDVDRIDYMPHNVDRKGKTPCLRVRYTSADGSSVSEYVCLMHEGFAKKKAVKWWNERAGGEFENVGLNLIASVMCQELDEPTRILVGKQGKYDRIEDYDFLEPVLPAIEEESMFSTIEEIPFC